MKVIRPLQISASEFFGVVFNELIDDIKAMDNTTLTADAFRTGFIHVYKGEDPALKTTFEIVEYREDRFYKAARTSAGSAITISYDVVPAENGITVTFTYETDQPPKKGLFSAFSELIFLSRMSDKLYAIQRTVINQKEGFVEHKSNSPFFPDIRKSK